MAVTATTLRLQAELTRGLHQITDAQTRTLVAAWVEAWNEVEADLTDELADLLTAGERVAKAQLLRSTRLRAALGFIAEQLTELAAGAGVTITGDLQAVVDQAGAAQAAVVESQLPKGSDLVVMDAWSGTDRRAIAAIVRRSTQQITSRLRPMPAEAYDAVRRELIRGVVSGTNPRKTAARMVKRAEKRFNGGLNRALVIARTESLDAHREAARLAQAEHADVLQGWAWLAKLDTRTCPSCWAQNGSVHDLDEPGPFDHQCGRCARMSLTKSWADLGFDIEEPPSLMPDSEALFEALPSEAQLEILGPARFEAWIRGDFSMTSWSVRRTTPGWRDSFGVAPAPVLARRAVA